jgi:hypothetical protein
VREFSCHPDATGIRRNHDSSFLQSTAHRLRENWYRRQAVDRNTEEAFNLRRMNVNCNQVGDANSLQEVRNHARGDRFTATMSLVGARITEVGHDGRDTLGGRTTAGIGKGQQFNEVVIDWRRCRLQDEDFAPAHRLVKRHRYFTIWEMLDGTGAELSAEMTSDRYGQVRAGCASEDQEITRHLF